jgi:hypothetical protein
MAIRKPLVIVENRTAQLPVGDALSAADVDIAGVTEIDAALVDSDGIAVYDASATAIKKSLLSRVWTYISGKITGAISGVLTSNLTASRAVVSDGSGKVSASSVTSTELGYLSGVTSALQTQMNAKAPSASPTLSQVTVSGSAHDTSSITQTRTSGPYSWSSIITYDGRYLLRYGGVTVADGDFFSLSRFGRLWVGGSGTLGEKYLELTYLAENNYATISAYSASAGWLPLALQSWGSAVLIGTTTDDASGARLQVSGTVNLASGNAYKINNVQLVNARKTGWAAASGTASRATFATSTVTTEQLAQRVKALIDDLISHGLIGS